MPIDVTWDNTDKTIIRYDFIDPWTWDEFFSALLADDELLAEVEHTVHLVFNADQMRVVPPNPIARFRDIARFVNPQIGLLVIVGNNLWFQKLGELFYNVHGRRLTGLVDIKITQSLADARRLIATHDISRQR